MLEYQERVIIEKKELDEKISKLEVFLKGNIFQALSVKEQELLTYQLSTMNKYSSVLTERISLFK